MGLRWAIVGTGAISAKFVAGLTASHASRAELVVSRTQENGARFAGAFGIPRVMDASHIDRLDGVDVAYIAVPPAEHARIAIACLEAGTPVLIEKPMAASAAQARRIADAAHAAGLFCMEAMWTRFLPAARRLKELVDSGAFGEIHQVAGSFASSNRVDVADGRFDPAHGGGALAQLGVYPLSLAHWLFGAPERIHATGRIGATGVDEDVALALRYPGGVTGSFHASLRTGGGNGFSVHGTHGHAAFAGPIFRPHGLRRHGYAPRRRPGAAAALVPRARLREKGGVQKLAQLLGLMQGRGRLESHHYAGNGYHYQVDEVERCLAAGLRESPLMPLSESIAIAETVDLVRRALHDDR